MDAVTANDLVLHHYSRSPFAEKVRIAFGLKGLRWRSAIQPRIAPKPELVQLTGGYRRIPVLQIGADIYCDTRCILAELERRFPTPTLYPPGTRGHADVIAGWADRVLFANALGLVFGLKGDSFPPELHADRASFTAGKFDGWDSTKMHAQLPELRDQFRVHLSWLDDCISSGGEFLLGDAPSLADIAVYHPLWYVRGNLGESEGLAAHPRVLAWMDRIARIGHGEVQDISVSDTLSLARNVQPALVTSVGNATENSWRPGDRLSIMPVDWGFDAVVGEFIAAGDDCIALLRDDADVGAVVVHFPRMGFAISRM